MEWLKPKKLIEFNNFELAELTENPLKKTENSSTDSNSVIIKLHVVKLKFIFHIIFTFATFFYHFF